MPKDGYYLRWKMEILSVLPINIFLSNDWNANNNDFVGPGSYPLDQGERAFDPNATKYVFINKWGIEVQVMDISIEFTY